MSISKIKRDSITADAVNETKIADNAISEEHLDDTIITGQTELAETAAGTDVLLVYDASAGTLKKIQASNVGLQAPTLSSISPTAVLTGDGTGNHTFTFTGTGFIASAVPTLITDGGTDVAFDSFTIDSNTQITAVIAKSSLSDANEPYDARVTVSGGLSATILNQVTIDESPIFNTASGSLGTFSEQTTISTIDIEAYDPDSAGNVTFEIQSGSLPPGLSASTVNENGVTKYRITGTLSTDRASSVTTNFTLRAADAASNTTSRAFSITEIPSGIESFTSSGTFSVPTGITSVDVLVVAGGAGGAGGTSYKGGGGGAGGLIFIPNFTVSPGGTVTVTVGCGGGAGSGEGQPGQAGQDSVFGTLTAKGGGGGGGGGSPNPNSCNGFPGGSGGGAGARGAQPSARTGGPATQPTQPGQSGAYGFGNAGGDSDSYNSGNAGGGGGAGAAGTAGADSQPSTPGGVGKAYTIADGTTPVTYASGGQGGNGAHCTSPATISANSGNGGQGACFGQTTTGVTGSKGVVIVKY